VHYTKLGRPTSASGTKADIGLPALMSVLAPKADIVQHNRDVPLCAKSRHSFPSARIRAQRHAIRSVSNSARQASLNSRMRLTEPLLTISRSSMKLLSGSR
jgi:hypothetical protein